MFNLSPYGIVIVFATLIYYLPLGTLGLPYVFWYTPVESVFVDTILPTYVPAAVEESIPLESPIIEKPKPKGIWAVLAFLEIIFGRPADWLGSKLRHMLLHALQLVTVGFFAAALLSLVSRVNQTAWMKGWSGIGPFEVAALNKHRRIVIPGIAIERRLRFYWLADGRLNWQTAPAILSRYVVAPTYRGKIVSIFRDITTRCAFFIDLGVACFSGLKQLVSTAFAAVINGNMTVSDLLFKGGLLQRFREIKDAHWYSTLTTKGLSEFRKIVPDVKTGTFVGLNGATGLTPNHLPSSRLPKIDL